MNIGVFTRLKAAIPPRYGWAEPNIKIFLIITGYKIFAFLGISYLTFKSLQIIIEIHDGLIEKVKTFDFFYFLLFFPALISGPIDRSRRFNEDINTVMSKEEYTELFGDGLLKICKGLFYKFVLATASFQLITILGSDDDWVSMLINMYSYGIYNDFCIRF